MVSSKDKQNRFCNLSSPLKDSLLNGREFLRAVINWSVYDCIMNSGSNPDTAHCRVFVAVVHGVTKNKIHQSTKSEFQESQQWAVRV